MESWNCQVLYQAIPATGGFVLYFYSKWRVCNGLVLAGHLILSYWFNLRYVWREVMYDLGTWPEQPEPASTHTQMESHEKVEVPKEQKQEFRRSEEQAITQHAFLDNTVSTKADVTSTSLLGKRHHSLYANLNGFEVERIRKVSVQCLECRLQSLLSRLLAWQCIVLKAYINSHLVIWP